jgi:predicted amidohydrolase
MQHAMPRTVIFWTPSRFLIFFLAMVALLKTVTPQRAWAGGSSELQAITEVFEPAQPPADGNAFDRVAVIQWNPPGITPVGVTAEKAASIVKDHREELAQRIREAATTGAKLVITSEFGIIGYPDIPELPSEEDNYRNREDIAPYLEPIPGPSTEYFGQLAKELGIYLHVGLAELDAATNQAHNVVVAFDPQGQIVARYRKMNLFELEKNYLTAGLAPATYPSPWGLIGIVVCADIYSSQVLNAYKALGVKVLALSTSWAQMNTGMDYFRRAAQKTGAFVLAANQNYFPDSGVIAPDGSFQSHIRQTAGTAYGYLPRLAAPVETPAEASRPPSVQR